MSFGTCGFDSLYGYEIYTQRRTIYAIIVIVASAYLGLRWWSVHQQLAVFDFGYCNHCLLCWRWARKMVKHAGTLVPRSTELWCRWCDTSG